jgi:hypothetical protein
MGLLESTTAGCFGIGFLLAAALTELTSVRVTFAATAGGVIIATFSMAVLLRHGDEAPSVGTDVSDAGQPFDEAQLQIQSAAVDIAGGHVGGERRRPDARAL